MSQTRGRRRPSEETLGTLDAIAEICLRCFVMIVASMLFVWGVMFALGDEVHRLYSVFVDISRHEMDLLTLASLTLIKSLNVVLFLFPYLAIKLYLRGVR